MLDIRTVPRTDPKDTIAAQVFNDITDIDVASGSVLKAVGILTHAEEAQVSIGLVVISASTKRPILLELSYTDFIAIAQAVSCVKAVGV